MAMKSYKAISPVNTLLVSHCRTGSRCKHCKHLMSFYFSSRILNIPKGTTTFYERHRCSSIYSLVTSCYRLIKP